MNDNINNIKILLDKTIYPLEAIYGASYVFIDKAYIFLDEGENGRIAVFLKPKKDVKEKLEILKQEFLNELLNYTIRVKLNKDNKKIKEFIISQALVAAAGAQDESYLKNKPKNKNKSNFEYEKDPLGIAVPWEEKYGKRKNKKGHN